MSESNENDGEVVRGEHKGAKVVGSRRTKVAKKVDQKKMGGDVSESNENDGEVVRGSRRIKAPRKLQLYEVE